MLRINVPDANRILYGYRVTSFFKGFIDHSASRESLASYRHAVDTRGGCHRCVMRNFSHPNVNSGSGEAYECLVSDAF